MRDRRPGREILWASATTWTRRGVARIRGARVSAAQIRASEEVSELAPLPVACIAIDRTVCLAVVRYAAQGRVGPKGARCAAARLMQHVVDVDRSAGISEWRGAAIARRATGRIRAWDTNL